MSWDDDESYEGEWVDQEGDDSPSATVACDECGSDIYEDAVRCPVCGNYVTASSRRRIKLHWRIVALVLLGLTGLYLVQMLLATF